MRDRALVLQHELRNPLAAIAAAMELIARSSPQLPTVTYAVELLRRQVALIDAIIQDVVTSATVDAALDHPHPLVDVCGCVRQAVEICQPLLALKGHELSTELPRDAVWWRGRGSQLVQVLVNLIDNSARYTRNSGHIRITLEARDGNIAVAVGDDGIGMEPEALARVLCPYTRDGAGEQLNPGGRGIGLAIVDEIVRTHGGAVRIASPGTGRGTTFTVVLPVVSRTASNGAAGPS